MSNKSPFAIQKALIGIGGEPKSVKGLRSGDLLIETNSALQTKSLLLAKSFLNSPLAISLHKTLNSCRGVISELDLLTTPDGEILDEFSDQGVIQVRRITIKKDNSVIPTKHLILTLNSPTLPKTIKVGYLNCKIRPYIPNPLRCFKCQRSRHSQTACRGQLTCSRCASVGRASSDCTPKQKCVNGSQPHSADSKLCPKWKIEKETQTIKTNKNISYIEARKFITPQPSQTYAQVAKSINVNSSSQTEETITKIVCPPLKLLQPLITISKPNMSSSVPAVTKSSTLTQAQLVPSTSSVLIASPSKSQPTNSLIDTVSTASDNLSISTASSSSTACSVLETTTTLHPIPYPLHPRIQLKPQNPVRKKRPPKNQSNTIKPKIEIKTAPHRPRKSAPTEYSTDEEDMIIYDVCVEDEPELNPKYVLAYERELVKGQ
ncbi:RNA-directed DNA polymerase from mobile element jockey [Trichonephila clavipes]|nr:RNA-directed DNA polymerase from mobile element jockey [Trichonephila clavipes]